jgi:AmmeMemoRadiSam system protein A
MVHLDIDAQKELLVLARKTLEWFLATGEVPGDNPERPELHEPAGAFVSLHCGDELRGCIGLIKPDGPLYRTVQHCAVSAASEDYRFERISSEELPDITIEISVLSPLEKTKDISEITVGEHGLYVVRGQRRGLLLPQVATDWGWDREAFLAQTCQKAGLEENAWRDPATIIYQFQAQVFSE